MDFIHSRLELRAEEAGPSLYAVILQEGRAASGGRAEVFAPGSAVWSNDGVDVRLDHGEPPAARAFPVRAEDGRIEIRVRATDPIQRAVESGRQYMSVEFHSVLERRTKAGVREIQRAIIVGAALVSTPEYDTTSAEIRTSKRRYYL